MRRSSPLDLEAALPIGWAPPRLRRLAARLCIGLAVASLVLAAARPLASAQPVRPDAVVELVIDVSGSTNADDLPPTRAAAMQRAALRLLDRGRSRRPAGPGDLLRHGDRAGPLEVARRARSLHVPVFGVAVGTETATVSVPDEATGQLRQIPVPPDPIGLGWIADATGGRVRLGRSASELDRALQDLAVRAGIIEDSRELSLLFVAAALLLLAVGGALWRRAPSPDIEPGRRAGVRRWAPVLSLLALSAGAVLAWARWVPVQPTPRPVVASVATGSQTPVIALTRPPFVSIDGTKRDRTLMTRAVALLRRHGELAEQRRA